MRTLMTALIASAAIGATSTAATAPAITTTTTTTAITAAAVAVLHAGPRRAAATFEIGDRRGRKVRARRMLVDARDVLLR